MMFSALSQGNLGGLVMLVFIVPTLYFIMKHREEQEQIRRGQMEKRHKAEERARQERARKEWEQTPAGQAHLEQQCREREEKDRLEKERRQREAEEVERRRREREEEIARANWRKFHKSKTMLEIATMTGLDFEQFLARLLTKMGYTDLIVTPINDQGGDLVGNSPEGLQIVVQAKRWKNALGNGVVQEILGAMLHYDCQAGLIITNSTFTTAAQSLGAKDKRITLCDRRWLEEQVCQYLPPVIPEFNWTDYNQQVKGGISAPHQHRVSEN